MRSSYGTERTFEDEDYPRKRVNIGTSFLWSEPLLRTELTGQLLEAESQGSGAAPAGPQPVEGRACVGSLCFSLSPPTPYNQMFEAKFGLTGFDGREGGKDTLLIFCPTKKQTELDAVRGQAVWAQAHACTTLLRNTQEDSCGLNGWQSTEIKRVLTRKCQT